MKHKLILLLLAVSFCISSVTTNTLYATDYEDEEISTEDEEISTEEEVDEEELEIQREIEATEKCKTSISKIKNDRQRIRLKIKKKKGYNYEVQYSRYKSFKKNVTKVIVRKTSYLSAKLSNSTYYVRVRVYKRIDGKTYYGKFSKVKKIKIK